MADNGNTRRDFLKTTSAAVAGASLTSLGSAGAAVDQIIATSGDRQVRQIDDLVTGGQIRWRGRTIGDEYLLSTQGRYNSTSSNSSFLKIFRLNCLPFLVFCSNAYMKAHFSHLPQFLDLQFADPHEENACRFLGT